MGNAAHCVVLGFLGLAWTAGPSCAGLTFGLDRNHSAPLFVSVILIIEYLNVVLSSGLSPERCETCRAISI